MQSNCDRGKIVLVHCTTQIFVCPKDFKAFKKSNKPYPITIQNKYYDIWALNVALKRMIIFCVLQRKKRRKITP